MTFFDVIINNDYDNSYLLNKTSFNITNINDIKRIDLKDLMSSLNNFEILGSTANAIATLIEYDINNFRCSRMFLYYIERLDTDTYNINNSIKKILEYGYCSYEDYEYDVNKINMIPPDEIFEKAKENKYKFDIIKIKKDLQSLLLSLINNEPFMVSIKVYESFEILLKNNQTKIKIPKSKEKLIGGITIVVCGFDINSHIFIIRYLNMYLELPFFYLLKDDYSSDCFIFILRSFYKTLIKIDNNIDSSSSIINNKKITDLRNNFPEVYDQGKIGSCTANALCSIFEYDSKYKFRGSRLFLYYNERLLINETDKDEGAYLIDGITSLQTHGICDEKYWEYIIENIYTKPTNEAYINAKNNFIIEAFTISNNIESIKEWLDKNEPIATGIPIYSNFISSKTGIIENPNKSDKLLGGHAVIICGYNDFDERFIMRNSWGTHWGDNGYFYLSYSYILNINNIELWIISKSKFYSQ